MSRFRMSTLDQDLPWAAQCTLLEAYIQHKRWDDAQESRPTASAIRCNPVCRFNETNKPTRRVAFPHTPYNSKRTGRKLVETATRIHLSRECGLFTMSGITSVVMHSLRMTWDLPVANYINCSRVAGRLFISRLEGTFKYAENEHANRHAENNVEAWRRDILSYAAGVGSATAQAQAFCTADDHKALVKRTERSLQELLVIQSMVAIAECMVEESLRPTVREDPAALYYAILEAAVYEDPSQAIEETIQLFQLHNLSCAPLHSKLAKKRKRAVPVEDPGSELRKGGGHPDAHDGNTTEEE